jgi:hypothetical protein
VIPGKPGKMEKTNLAAFSEPGYSNNLTKLSTKKKENLVARILATKIHTEPTDEPGSGDGIRLNPFMKDLIINAYENGHHMQDGKGKIRKRWKTEVEAKMVESIGESQPDWLDTLNEEIANLK